MPKSIPTRLERQKYQYRKESKLKKSLKGRELTSTNSLMNTCMIRIYRVYVGSSKAITLSVEEILATEIERRSSYFDEYSEESD